MAFLGALAPLLTTVAAGIGIYTGVKALQQSKESSQASAAPAPEPVAPPPVPTPEEAQVSAVAEVKKRRKMSMLTGGITDLTRGKALVPETNIGRKSLLGA